MPFSLPEVGSEQLLLHWVRGSFPQSWLAPNEGLSLLWRKNYLDSFVFRDLVAMGFGVTPVTMRKLFEMLAHVHGNVLNISTLATALGVSQGLVKSYTDILVGCFMAQLLQPYFVNVGKRLVKSPKVYIRDTGLLHTLLQLANYN